MITKLIPTPDEARHIATLNPGDDMMVLRMIDNQPPEGCINPDIEIGYNKEDDFNYAMFQWDGADDIELHCVDRPYQVGRLNIKGMDDWFDVESVGCKRVQEISIDDMYRIFGEKPSYYNQDHPEDELFAQPINEAFRDHWNTAQGTPVKSGDGKTYVANPWVWVLKGGVSKGF